MVVALRKKCWWKKKKKLLVSYQDFGTLNNIGYGSPGNALWNGNAIIDFSKIKFMTSHNILENEIFEKEMYERNGNVSEKKQKIAHTETDAKLCIASGQADVRACKQKL